jgi:hypothetical protein
MNLYQKVSVVLALALYFPLAWQILRKTIEQNLATFILWGSLDVIAAISIMIQGGNYQLPAAYVAGCVLIILCILRTKTFKWTWFETFVSLLVVTCLVGWYYSGPRLATILSTTGVCLAGLPQIKDVWLGPNKKIAITYFGYTIVNGLSVAGGKVWTVEERLYPFCCMVMCIIVTVLSLRKENSQEVVAEAEV